MVKRKLLVAGVAGASLGTEILKCLSSVDAYGVYACDIEPLAYGLHVDMIDGYFVADPKNYVKSVIEICRRNHIELIVPGSEQSTAFLSAARDVLSEKSIKLAANSAGVAAVCNNKVKTFECLQENGIRIPRSLHVKNMSQLTGFTYPCVVKPAEESGGSAFTFLAAVERDAALYCTYLLENGKIPFVQEYIPLDGGEFTVGVLSYSDGTLGGSVALQRIFISKLSYLTKTEAGLISSGYSQGLIDDFPEIRGSAERIAAGLGSTGPLNIQGRVSNGVFVPFEINPRFSTSTYLRAKAGFNEVASYVSHIFTGEKPKLRATRFGYYLRSFDENFIPAART